VFPASATEVSHKPPSETVTATPTWLQFWLQLTLFAVARRRPPQSVVQGQLAYGTAADRPERDHDGLAVCGSRVLSGGGSPGAAAISGADAGDV
jgi:hypothetical protein